jgi:hypothetical protein
VKQDKSLELLDEVRRQMGDGKFSRAFATLKDLLASNPSHQEGRRLLATLLLKFGNLATAKNAFETLVKEALQRRDYVESESLLHEYLTVGPRHVAFIEMLGTTYELKGDPLAAVFEYEKAIDIVLEDPDPERPTYAQDLFQKIKQLAPSSFVANRVAARLQPITTMQAPGPAPSDPPSDPHDDEIESGELKTVSKASDEADLSQAHSGAHDGEVQGDAPAESDEQEMPSEIHEQPTVQNAAAQPVLPKRPPRDENVPFPPVNKIPKISERRLAEKNHESERGPASGLESQSASDDDGFGVEPVREPSRVGFFSQDSDVAASTPSTSDAGPSLTREETVPEEGELRKPTSRDDSESGQDTYWARVLGGTGSTVSVHQGATSASVEDTDAKEPSRHEAKRRYGRNMARWLSYRLSIISRRLTAATSSFTKLALVASLAIVAWVVLIIGGTAALWLGLEQKPSEAFQRVMSVSPSKTLEDWKNNGYILLIGFGAAPSMDPMQAGYDRWLSVTAEPPQGCLDRPAKGGSAPRVNQESPQSADPLRTSDPSTQLVAEGARVKETLDPQGHLVNRYRRWLNLPFEDWGFNYVGHPDCRQVLAVHRLYLAEGFTQSLNVGLDRLEADLTAWRKVLAQSKTLSIKAMAVEGVNDDLAVMSGLLTRQNIDNKFVQRMMRLARPLDPEERSLRWPMQNEFALAVKRMDSRIRPHADTDPALAIAIAKMPLPKQRTLNMYADYYEALMKASGSPNAPATKLYDFANTPSKTWLDYLYNPIDNLIVADPMPAWGALTGFIIETDARLRLVGLQARLRLPSSEPSLSARIAQAGPSFYDPFTELPMMVSGSRGSIYSVGMDHKDDGGDPIFDVSVPLYQ